MFALTLSWQQRGLAAPGKSVLAGDGELALVQVADAEVLEDGGACAAWIRTAFLLRRS